MTIVVLKLGGKGKKKNRGKEKKRKRYAEAIDGK